MARYLWNTPEYKAQFEAYKAGEASSLLFDEDLINVEMGPRHITELTTAARALLRRRKSGIHIFSEGALEAVDLDTSTTSVSLVRNAAKNAFSFIRLVAVEPPSLKELQRQHDLEGLHRQFAEEDGKPLPNFEDPRPLADQINWAETHSHDQLRITEAFSGDQFLDDESMIEHVWSKEARSIAWGCPEPMVDVYMTLGHMIEFDKKQPATPQQ